MQDIVFDKCKKSSRNIMIVKAGLSSLFCFAFIGSLPIILKIVMPLLVFLGSCIYEWMWVFDREMGAHYRLRKEYGDQYVAKALAELDKTGAEKMLLREWFTGQERKFREERFSEYK